MSAALQIHTIVSMPFEENTYIVWRAGQPSALVFDPGLEPDPILAFLDEQALQPAAILNTHGHADHIAGNEALKQRYPDAPLIIGVNETALLTDPVLNMSAPFGFAIVSPAADRAVREGEVLEFAEVRLEVLEIPGHSPGHVVFVVRVYYTNDGKQLSTFKGINGPIYTLAFHPTGTIVASAGFEGVVHLNDPSTGALIREFVAVPLKAKAK